MIGERSTRSTILLRRSLLALVLIGSVGLMVLALSVGSEGWIDICYVETLPLDLSRDAAACVIAVTEQHHEVRRAAWLPVPEHRLRLTNRSGDVVVERTWNGSRPGSVPPRGRVRWLVSPESVDADGRPMTRLTMEFLGAPWTVELDGVGGIRSAEPGSAPMDPAGVRTTKPTRENGLRSRLLGPIDETKSPLTEPMGD